MDNALYTCQHIRSCEHQAMTVYQLDDMELMLRAGMEALYFIQTEYPKARHIAVFCGSGNNAGDGYMFARLAQEQGLSVIVYQCKGVEELPAPAHNAALLAIAAGVDCQPAGDQIDSETELLVDALLGIGVVGPVYGLIADAIQQINASGLPVVSLDIPSGMQADTGKVDNFCVKADATLTFIGLKAGMFTLDGPDYCGQVYLRSLQMEPCLATMKPLAYLMAKTNLPLPLALRKKNTHKGDYGHVLVIGGNHGMPGSVCLTAKAALRTGAGSVSIATRSEHAKVALSSLPEAMIWPVEKAKDLLPLLKRATVCVIGPGLGEDDWAKALFEVAITSQLPMIIDASALRLLALSPQRDDNWVLTPHPGEAATLLACSVNEVQGNRFKAAAQIQKQYGGILVLKGVGTLVQTEDNQTFVCPIGNPGMASAGMGDVLAGIIGALCAQGLSLQDSAEAGVWIHAKAGDKAAQEIAAAGFLASDLLEFLPQILRDSGHKK